MTRRLLMGAFAIAAGVAVWTLAQGPAAGSLPLAAIAPPGALLYLEAKDFGALLADWNGSAEKRAWLLSNNYQVFSRSRLFLRLEQSQQEFAAAAGLPGDMALAGEVAGSNSALALYDIGQLQFLYVTRMPAARAATTALWKKRGSRSGPLFALR